MSIVTLSIGSNLGYRFCNIRKALKCIEDFIEIGRQSVVFETKAIVPTEKQGDCNWSMPYLNMVLIGNTALSPHELLDRLQQIEIELGRDPNHERWSPRPIDIDILYYDDIILSGDRLTIPHKEIQNRPFLRSLLNNIGFAFNDDCVNEYTPENSFVLNPKFVGVVNVTPDSFSDGGLYTSAEAAIQRIDEVFASGGYIAELGAQSTRPGYTEISPEQEIKRLSSILDRLESMKGIGVDSYFDEVVTYALHRGVQWIDDVMGNISKETIKCIAEHNATLVTMLHGMDVESLRNRIDYLRNCGMSTDNVIVDPGIGFGKTKMQNIEMLRNIDILHDFGVSVMVGHSRKSFITAFSNTPSHERDIESIAISSYLHDRKIEYLRVHDVRSHNKFFVAKQSLLLT